MIYIHTSNSNHQRDIAMSAKNRVNASQVNSHITLLLRQMFSPISLLHVLSILCVISCAEMILQYSSMNIFRDAAVMSIAIAICRIWSATYAQLTKNYKQNYCFSAPFWWVQYLAEARLVFKVVVVKHNLLALFMPYDIQSQMLIAAAMILCTAIIGIVSIYLPQKK